MVTLRQRQEAIVRLIERFERSGRLDLQSITDHANASIAILDTSDWSVYDEAEGRVRIVPDPESAR